MGWCVYDVMPRRDGPENLSQLKVDIGPWRQTVEFLSLRGELWIRPLSQRVEIFGYILAEMNRDLKHHEMCRTLGVALAYYDYERL